MKTLATLGLALCATIPGLASNIDGKLMDATCYNEKKVATQQAGHKTYRSITKDCAANSSTTAFAVRVTTTNYFGETLKLDDHGNSLAADAMRAGTLKSDEDGDVKVFVNGKMTSSQLMQAKSIEAEK